MINPGQDIYGCDPGKTYYSAARVVGGQLVSAIYLTDPTTPPDGWCGRGYGVVERPDRREARVPLEDVIALSIAAGQITMHFGAHETVTPARWKGQTPKLVHQERIKKALTADELRLIAGLPQYKVVQVLDAIGIAMWFAKRID